ncbi:AAA family ATPase [Puerhibacterium puerhi]|uniref:AAA family ATPase n=1 Tax=Puerhibacterium puerhi TaxID=2692623 RepID=UPI00135CD9F2|nr:AAA family ATPase [Puerhibacterium puerhi]
MITVSVRDDGTGGTVALPDRTIELEPGTPSTVQDRAIAVLHRHAAAEGRPVLVKAEQGADTQYLEVSPDGRVQVAEHAAIDTRPDTATTWDAADHEPILTTPLADPAPAVPAPAGAADGSPAAAPVDTHRFIQNAPEVVEPPQPEPEPRRGAEEPAAAASDRPPLRTRREARQSFLTQEQIEEPATQGWRGFLTRVGIRQAPSEAERAQRTDAQAVSQHWPGPRTIAIVNGKGGASKTPSTILLAAVFARYGGAGVLTWDNNQTRGTLGWRTEQGPHEATLLDLLPQVDRLLSTGAQSADLAHYVHHQTRDKFDVLRSKPDVLASEQRITAEDVDAIHAVAAKYYRLIFIDSGNDETDPMWRRMIDHTDQLVVATTTRDDHAEAGALLLEALADRGGRAARLAQGAVAIVSQADRAVSTTDVQHVAAGYRELAREVATIPFDPAMVDGILRYGSLRPTTQRAWLAAGAAVARGL